MPVQPRTTLGPSVTAKIGEGGLTARGASDRR